jgi:hypothetical protein
MSIAWRRPALDEPLHQEGRRLAGVVAPRPAGHLAGAGRNGRAGGLACPRRRQSEYPQLLLLTTAGLLLLFGLDDGVYVLVPTVIVALAA